MTIMGVFWKNINSYTIALKNFKKIHFTEEYSFKNLQNFYYRFSSHDFEFFHDFAHIWRQVAYY